jgi:hypothetical protein
MDELPGDEAQPGRWSRSGSLCAEVGTGRAVLSPRPFPRSGSLPPLRFGQFFLNEAEHFLQNRMASVGYAPRVFGFIPGCRSVTPSETAFGFAGILMEVRTDQEE